MKAIVANYSIAGHIKPVSPFDFAQSMRFLDCFVPMQGEQAVGKISLIKAIQVQGQTLGCKISSVGTIEEPLLEYHFVSAQPISEHTKTLAIDRIEFFLSLGENLQSFYDIGLRDEVFAPIVRQLYGYHQVKFTTPFESACWAILSQRNPMTIARKRKLALTEWFNNCIHLDGKDYLAFPETNQVLNLQPEALNKLICNQQKTEYLQRVAAAFNTVDETFLRTGEYNAVKDWLYSIPGVGEWSAALILIRGLGRMEQTAPEKRLVESASQIYGKQVKSYADVQQIAQHYGCWQGYWAHYLRVAA